MAKERDYKKSLWPPGTDLSLYTFDPTLYWCESPPSPASPPLAPTHHTPPHPPSLHTRRDHALPRHHRRYVTPDGVWWFRPDLLLWYDCRNESYYTFDASLSDYVSVEAATATNALAQGISVAPEAVAARSKAEASTSDAASDVAAAAAAQAEQQALAHAQHAEQERARQDALRQQASEAAAAAEAEAEAEAAGAATAAAQAQAQAQEAELDAEDRIAQQLRSHTESWQGKKDTQEDRFLPLQRLGKLGTAFGVFDGHGGTHAPEYAAKHLTGNVVRCWQQQRGSSRDSSDSAAGAKKLVSAMQEAFDVTDKDLLQLARRKKYSDGTTALLALLGGSDINNLLLYTANLGDCRAVLCRGCTAMRLTNDHRPDRKDEQRRIKEAGGGVFQVCGIWRCTDSRGAARATSAHGGFTDSDTNLYLSCSRTLGDPELKVNADRPILSNVPEVEVRKLQPTDLFVVLACDGVWDVISDQQAVDLVLEHWGDPAAAASTVVRTALSSGSGDNVTAQVVMFGWRGAEGDEFKAQRHAQKAAEARAVFCRSFSSRQHPPARPVHLPPPFAATRARSTPHRDRPKPPRSQRRRRSSPTRTSTCSRRADATTPTTSRREAAPTPQPAAPRGAARAGARAALVTPRHRAAAARVQRRSHPARHAPSQVTAGLRDSPARAKARHSPSPPPLSSTHPQCPAASCSSPNPRPVAGAARAACSPHATATGVSRRRRLA